MSKINFENFQEVVNHTMNQLQALYEQYLDDCNHQIEMSGLDYPIEQFNIPSFRWNVEQAIISRPSGKNMAWASQDFQEKFWERLQEKYQLCVNACHAYFDRV